MEVSIALGTIYQWIVSHTLAVLEREPAGVTLIDIDWHTVITSARDCFCINIVPHFAGLCKCAPAAPRERWVTVLQCWGKRLG